MRQVGIASVVLVAAVALGCGQSDEPSDTRPSRFALVSNLDSDNVSVYAIDPVTGGLTPVAGAPFGAGRLPWCVAVTPSGAFAYVANVGTDSRPGGISSFAIDASSGALSAIGGGLMPAGEHPRAVAVEPAGSFLYVADSGVWGSSTQKGNVWAFAIKRTTGELTLVPGSPFPAGVNPGALAVHPSGRFLYALNSTGGDVSAYSIDSATGALRPVAGSPFPSGSGPMSMAVHPSGGYAYVVNHTGHSVSIFSVDASTGALRSAAAPLSPGRYPSSVAIHPSGAFAFVTSWWDDNVQAYAIDRGTGALTPVPGSPFAAGYTPISVAVSSTGSFVYVANAAGYAPGDVSAYRVDSATGALTPVAGSPFDAGTSPYSIAVAP